jgi:uncharacterized membrane protein
MNRKYISFGAVVATLIVIALAIWIATPTGFLEAFRIVFGSVYVLFLPGFLVTWIIFPKTTSFGSHASGGIDWLERIALSFALSIAIVPLVVFYLNLVGLKISALMAFITVTVINAIAIGLIYVMNVQTTPFRRWRL